MKKMERNDDYDVTRYLDENHPIRSTSGRFPGPATTGPAHIASVSAVLKCRQEKPQRNHIPMRPVLTKSACRLERKRKRDADRRCRNFDLIAMYSENLFNFR